MPANRPPAGRRLPCSSMRSSSPRIASTSRLRMCRATMRAKDTRSICFSRTSTRTSCSRSSAASIAPVGPHPAMITSNVLGLSVLEGRDNRVMVADGVYRRRAGHEGRLRGTRGRSLSPSPSLTHRVRLHPSRPSPAEAIVTVDELIAQLQQCPQDFDVQVLEPRNEKDADGMFSVAIVVPADKTPTIYLTA